MQLKAWISQAVLSEAWMPTFARQMRGRGCQPESQSRAIDR